MKNAANIITKIEKKSYNKKEQLYIEYLGLNDFVYSFPNRLTQP